MVKLSVIIPVYNVEEHYLIKCIESVINQTFQGLDIILVDDGSTDNSGNICEDFASKDNRINVIHKLNAGLSSARNAGLDAASGDFIAFVDCDDFINPYMFFDLINIAISNNVDIVQGGYLKVDPKYNQVIPKVANSPKELIKQKQAIKYFFKDYILTSVIWDKIYKKHTFSSLRFPEGQWQEDAFILTNIYMEIRSDIIVTDQVYYYYVQRENSKLHANHNIEWMTSSFKSYENRMSCALKLQDQDLFNLAAKQLASDFLQYYRLIYLNKIDGEKHEFYSIINKWLANNRKHIKFSSLKLELLVLSYFPNLIGLHLRFANLKKWMQMTK